MISNKSGRATSVVSFALVAGLSLWTFACSPDKILEVQDPDIIAPENVQSAAGADAVRLGALSRFVGATSGAESLFFLGGLFTDEWNNGDSYIDRQEIDERIVSTRNSYILGTNRQIHRTRLSAEQAIQLLREWNPTAPGWQIGEMYMIEAYVINLLAEDFCDGIIISDVVEGREEYGSPIPTADAFARALALADSGLAVTTGATTNDARVKSALALTKGRILMNLDRYTEAAAAVAGVPTSFEYVNYHSQATWDNAWWSWNGNSRRYSVSDNEGVNGLDFVSANDPRVPVCEGGDAACRAIGVTKNVRDDLTSPIYILMSWPLRGDAVPIMQGVDARMIQAEAALDGGDAAGALTILNTARATRSMAPLTDAGTAAARRAQLFRERAFWEFSRGYRLGNLRRLVRQYGMNQSQVFPVGAWHKGGTYGSDVNMPVPQAEENNPNLGITEVTCMNRGA
jgi:hypothetical protein